jgi:hypothetical protein
MASRSSIYESNSDNEDLVFIGATKGQKRKSTALIDDEKNPDAEDDDLTLLDKPVNVNRKRNALPIKITETESNKAKKENAEKLAGKQSLAQRIDRICEYAQVLMHCLLFKINYYNKKTHFEKYLKYNTIVYVNVKLKLNLITFKLTTIRLIHG